MKYKKLTGYSNGTQTPTNCSKARTSHCVTLRPGPTARRAV